MIQPTGFIVMGVSGCGKSTIASLLAQRLGWNFFDADDFHPAENVAKMKAGTPLNDHDRAPWLERLHDLLASEQNAGRYPILACSALKDRYRAVLRQNLPNLIVIYLRGTEELIRSRMECVAIRKAHRAQLDGTTELLSVEIPHRLSRATVQALGLHDHARRRQVGPTTCEGGRALHADDLSMCNKT